MYDLSTVVLEVISIVTVAKQTPQNQKRLNEVAKREADDSPLLPREVITVPDRTYKAYIKHVVTKVVVVKQYNTSDNIRTTASSQI